MLPSMSAAVKAKPRATYQDVLDAPSHVNAEIVSGELFLSPRPAGPHTSAMSLLGAELVVTHDRRARGRGDWLILFEPELHFGEDIVVPDLAGWRYEARPESMDVAYFEHAPAFVCETLSPSTARLDRVKKLPVYARAGVLHVWFVDPVARTLEVYALDGATYRLVLTASDEDEVTPPPFASPVALSRLWAW